MEDRRWYSGDFADVDGERNEGGSGLFEEIVLLLKEVRFKSPEESKMSQLGEREPESSVVVNRTAVQAQIDEFREREDGTVKLHRDRVEGQSRDICRT